MKKIQIIQIILVITILVNNISVTSIFAKSETEEFARVSKKHEQVDELGNKYFLNNQNESMLQGDFQGYFKEGDTYKMKYKNKEYESAPYFITLSKDYEGIEANTVVFCIEPDKEAVFIEGIEQEENAYSKLKMEIQNQLTKTVSITTNLFASTGNYDYLSAGQLLVWQDVGADILHVSKGIQEEINQIESLISEYEELPSFMKDQKGTYTLTYNPTNQKYEIYLKDETGILDEHFLNSLTGKYGIYNVEDGPEKNDLYIWADVTNELEQTQTIKGTYDPLPKSGEKAKIKYSKEPTFINSGQDLISGISYPVNIELNFKIEKATGEATLKKCGKTEGRCQPLLGASFGLYDQNDKLLDEQITDKNGEIKFSNIPLGQYYVKEIQAPVGYMINEQKYEFNITKDQEKIQINGGNYIENVPITSHVSLKKVGPKSLTDNLLIPLQDVEFALYQDQNSNQVLDEKDPKIDQYITDDKGEISMYLPQGKYIIKETKAISGYENSGYEEAFSIKNQGEEIILNQGDPVINNLSASEEKGSIRLLKKDAKTNDVLPGVEFSFYSDQNNNKKLDEQDIFINKYKTNEKGEILIENLENGNYLLKETKQLDGYVLSDEVYPTSISDSYKHQSLEVYNKKLIQNISEDLVKTAKTNILKIFIISIFSFLILVSICIYSIKKRINSNYI